MLKLSFCFGHLSSEDKKVTLKCAGLYYANSMIPQGTLELDKIVYNIAAKKFLTSYLIKEGVKEDFINTELINLSMRFMENLIMKTRQAIAINIFIN